MCPNVARFRVDSEDALEAGSEGGHGWPVPMQQEVIILQPIREDVMRNDTPSALPHLRHKIKSITKRSKATLQLKKKRYIRPLFDMSLCLAQVSITGWHEKSPLI